MKKTSDNTKKNLLIIFIVFEAIFTPITLLSLLIFFPVGLVGVVACVLYALVIISIKQSLAGKNPIIDLFREGYNTCRKCKHTYPRRMSLTCPHCARVRAFKRKYQSIIKSKEMPPKDEEHEDFWEEIGKLMILDELFDD